MPGSTLPATPAPALTWQYPSYVVPPQYSSSSAHFMGKASMACSMVVTDLSPPCWATQSQYSLMVFQYAGTMGLPIFSSSMHASMLAS